MKRLIREKAHRLPRTAYQGEVTASMTMVIKGRGRTFTDAWVVTAFVDLLREVAERRSCLVVVYCFMPDHLHLVLHGESSKSDLWRTTAEFKQRSGYWLYRHSPEISWQKDFHDHIIRQGDDLAAHVRYILENPCRRGLVSQWEEYPWKGSIGCRLEDILSGLPL